MIRNGSFKSLVPNDSLKSLFSVTSVTSDLSIFEQHLPQEPQRFCVNLCEGGHRATTSRNRSRQPTYDFDVNPRANIRVGSPSRGGSPLRTWCEADDCQDEHNMFLTGRTGFRRQRASHFTAGRQFPALLHPLVLPSFQRVTNGLSKACEALRTPEASLLPDVLLQVPRLQGRCSLASPQAFARTTWSTMPQHHVPNSRPVKIPRHNILLPYIPTGKRPKPIKHRTSKLEQGACPTTQRVREDFLPSCAKPKRRIFGRLSKMSTTAGSTFRSGAGITVSDWNPASSGDGEHIGLEVPAPESECTSDGFPKTRRHSRMASSPCPDSAIILGKVVASGDEESTLVDQHQQDRVKEAAKKALDKEEQAKFISIFKKVSEEGKVHRDDLPKALALAGITPNTEWIDKAFNKISKYVQIDLNDFMYFLEGYAAVQREHYKALFEEFDDDGSGSVDSSEIRALMKAMGIEPMKHVLRQVINEVDDNANGELDFSEFEKVMDILRRREGFTKEEYDQIFDLFRRFDRDLSGTMDTKEVHAALQWLGFSFSEKAADTIIAEIDEDQSGQIDVNEWFVCMRKVREFKMKKLQEVIAANDEEDDGLLEYSQLPDMLQSLGYVPDFDAVTQSAHDAEIFPDGGDLDFGELWRLLAVYRDREGLSLEDLDQVDSTFSKYVSAEEGDDAEVDVLDVGKVIRAIGYVIDFETQQNLINKVDIDCSGKLDKSEFRKMVRMIHDKDIETFRISFNQVALECAQDTPKLGGKSSKLKRALTKVMASSKTTKDKKIKRTLTLKQAIDALDRSSAAHESSVVLNALFWKEGPADGRIEFFQFCQAAIRSRRMSRAVFRDNGGFTRVEIAALRKKFERYDDDHSGELTGLEMIRLFEEEFPIIANDPDRRPQLVKLLGEADEDSSGTLNFKDFLRCMRTLRDMQEQMNMTKELDAVNATKFAPSEVAEFRELFLAVACEHSDDLSFEDVKELLKCIVPMGARNTDLLKIQFDKVAATENGVPSRDDMVDFPEFLWLMRELLDVNFAGMSDRAKAMAS